MKKNEMMVITIPDDVQFIPPIIGHNKNVKVYKDKVNVRCSVTDTDANLIIEGGPVDINIHLSPDTIMKLIDKIKNKS